MTFLKSKFLLCFLVLLASQFLSGAETLDPKEFKDLNLLDVEATPTLELLNPLTGASWARVVVGNLHELAPSSDLTDLVQQLFHKNGEQIAPSQHSTNVAPYLHPRLLGEILARLYQHCTLSLQAKKEKESILASRKENGGSLSKEDRAKLTLLGRLSINEKTLSTLFFSDPLVKKKIDQQRTLTEEKLQEEAVLRKELIEATKIFEWHGKFSLVSLTNSKKSEEEVILEALSLDLRRQKGALFSLRSQWEKLSREFATLAELEEYKKWSAVAYTLSFSSPDTRSVFPKVSPHKNPQALVSHAKTSFQSLLKSAEVHPETFQVLQGLLHFKARTKADVLEYYKGVQNILGDSCFSATGLSLLSDETKRQAWEEDLFDQSDATEEAASLENFDFALYRSFFNLQRVFPLIPFGTVTIEENKGYPDCGETSLRNFFLIFSSHAGKIHEEILKQLNARTDIIDFFREGFQTSPQARNQWGHILSGFNEKKSVHYQKNYTLKNGQSVDCEISAGARNMLALINELLFQGSKKVDDYNELGELIAKARKSVLGSYEGSFYIGSFSGDEEKNLGELSFSTSTHSFVWEFQSGHFQVVENKKDAKEVFAYAEALSGKGVLAERALALFTLSPTSKEKIELLIQLAREKGFSNTLHHSLFYTELGQTHLVDFFELVSKNLTLEDKKYLYRVLLFKRGGRNRDLCRRLFEISGNLQQEEDILRESLPLSGKILAHTSAEFRSREDLVRLALTDDGNALEFASDEFKAREDLVRLAMENNAEALRYAHVDLQSKRDLANQALQKNPFVMEHLPPCIQDDDELAWIAITGSNSYPFRFLSERLRNLETFVFEAMKNHSTILNYAGIEFLNTHRELVLKMASESSTHFQMMICAIKRTSYGNDPSFYNEVVANFGPDSSISSIFCHLPKELQSSPIFFLGCLKAFPERTMQSRFFYSSDWNPSAVKRDINIDFDKDMDKEKRKEFFLAGAKILKDATLIKELISFLNAFHILYPEEFFETLQQHESLMEFIFFGSHKLESIAADRFEKMLLSQSIYPLYMEKALEKEKVVPGSVQFHDFIKKMQEKLLKKWASSYDFKEMHPIILLDNKFLEKFLTPENRKKIEKHASEEFKRALADREEKGLTS